MEQVFARPGMVDPDRLKELSTKSDVRGWLQVISHFAAIGVTGFVLYLSLGSLWAVPAFIVHGILINYLYAGQHELSHWTVFRTKWLNDRIGELFGFLTLNPFHTDRWRTSPTTAPPRIRNGIPN